MYWAERELGTLRSARLDGSDVRTILSGLGNPQAVRIVPEPAARGTVWIFAVAFALSSDTLRRRERNRRAPALAWLGAIRTESGGTLFSRSRSCRNRRA
jgi:hypothetical protein